MTNLKILVFSDSHRCTSQMIAAIEDNAPDAVIHLGDHLSDTREIYHIYPKLPLACVPGNCDGWTEESAIKCIDYWGKKILLSHGHLWQVKQGYDRAIRAAVAAEADILLFGHTHVPHCQQQGNLWVMNPGASPQSYGVIVIEGDSVSCSLHSSDT